MHFVVLENVRCVQKFTVPVLLTQAIITTSIFLLYTLIGGVIFSRLEHPHLIKTCIEYADSHLNASIEWLCRAKCEDCEMSAETDCTNPDADFEHQMVFSERDLKYLKTCENRTRQSKLVLDSITYKEFENILRVKDELQVGFEMSYSGKLNLEI